MNATLTCSTVSGMLIVQHSVGHAHRAASMVGTQRAATVAGMLTVQHRRTEASHAQHRRTEVSPHSREDSAHSRHTDAGRTLRIAGTTDARRGAPLRIAGTTARRGAPLRIAGTTSARRDATLRRVALPGLGWETFNTVSAPPGLGWETFNTVLLSRARMGDI